MHVCHVYACGSAPDKLMDISDSDVQAPSPLIPIAPAAVAMVPGARVLPAPACGLASQCGVCRGNAAAEMPGIAIGLGGPGKGACGDAGCVRMRSWGSTARGASAVFGSPWDMGPVWTKAE